MPPKIKKPTHPFAVKEGMIHYATKDEERCLCNFDAKILEDVLYSDGHGDERSYVVEAAIEKEKRQTIVPVRVFSDSLNWVEELMGVDADIPYKRNEQQEIIKAIRFLSRDAGIKRQTIYTHTGWTEVNGQHVYLHGGGGIGPQGNLDIAVDLLKDKLARFILPDPPQDPCEAIWASFSLLDLADTSITLPLFAATYRVPLGPADYAVFVEGLTGVMKSELTALIQQHFGSEFVRRNLPGSFNATYTALLFLSFVMKDSIFVIDDYKPLQSNQKEMDRAADALIRGQGNSSGRDRCDATGRLQKRSHYPRGLAVMSGECLPPEVSLRARMMTVAVKPGDIDKQKLTDCQEAARSGLYAQSMASYLQWLAPQIADIQERLEDERIALRNELPVKQDWHNRLPDMIANQLLGMQYFLRFACEMEVITPDTVNEWMEHAKDVFIDLADAKQKELRTESECERALEAARAALSGKQAFFGRMDGANPGDAKGTLIGWADDDYCYCEPSNLFKVVQIQLRLEGKPLTVDKTTLVQRFADAGYLIKDKGHNLKKKRIGTNQRPRVMQISRDLFFPR